MENLYESCFTIGRNKKKRFYFNKDALPEISKVEKMVDSKVKEDFIEEVLKKIQR